MTQGHAALQRRAGPPAQALQAVFPWDECAASLSLVALAGAGWRWFPVFQQAGQQLFPDRDPDRALRAELQCQRHRAPWLLAAPLMPTLLSTGVSPLLPSCLQLRLTWGVWGSSLSYHFKVLRSFRVKKKKKKLGEKKPRNLNTVRKLTPRLSRNTHPSQQPGLLCDRAGKPLPNRFYRSPYCPGSLYTQSVVIRGSLRKIV